MTGSPQRELPAAVWWLPALRDPAACLDWSLSQWQEVLRQTRRLRLLARLAEQAAAAGLVQRLPPEVQRHLVAAMRASRWQTGSLVWGLTQVGAVLDPMAHPKVLLKGAAYIAQGLPIAAGRLPSDMDIMVSPQALPEARSRLVDAGWQAPALDAHDQHYYDAWSHEVPPMQHPSIRMELDLHHNILPPVGHVRIDGGLLMARLQASGLPGWSVLHPEDQILHSAAHLFFDSDLRGRLRDLADLDGLLRHFATGAGFWPGLQRRAQQLGLVEPLALALRLCSDWLDTPVPVAALRAAQAAGLGWWQQAWLLPLLRTVLLPEPPDRLESPRRLVAATALLLRHHRRRLPLRHLIPHTWHKLRRAAPSEA